MLQSNFGSCAMNFNLRGFKSIPVSSKVSLTTPCLTVSSGSHFPPRTWYRRYIVFSGFFRCDKKIPSSLYKQVMLNFVLVGSVVIFKISPYESSVLYFFTAADSSHHFSMVNPSSVL